MVFWFHGDLKQNEVVMQVLSEWLQFHNILNTGNGLMIYPMFNPLFKNVVTNSDLPRDLFRFTLARISFHQKFKLKTLGCFSLEAQTNFLVREVGTLQDTWLAKHQTSGFLAFARSWESFALSSAPNIGIKQKLSRQCSCEKYRYVSVTNLLHKKSTTLEQLRNCSSLRVSGALTSGDVELTTDWEAIMKSGKFECIAGMYGTMIPMISEYLQHGQIGFKKSSTLPIQIDNDWNNIEEFVQNHKDKFIDRICCDNDEFSRGKIDRDGAWVDVEYVVKNVKRLMSFDQMLRQKFDVPTTNNSEKPVEKMITDKCKHNSEHNFRLNGIIDNQIGYRVVEYKVKKRSEIKDFCQLIMYMWITDLHFGHLFYPPLGTEYQIEILSWNDFDLFFRKWCL